MPKDTFRLATLLRYREQIVEQRQQELHVLEQRLRSEQAAFERLQARVKGVMAAIHDAQAAGALDCDGLLRKFEHLELVKQQANAQRNFVDDVQRQVDAQRERLRIAMQDKQVLEKLKERHLAQVKQEETRREGQALDEIGGQRFHRTLQEKARDER